MRGFKIVFGPEFSFVAGCLLAASAVPKLDNPKSVAMGFTSKSEVGGEVSGGFAGKSSGVAPNGVIEDLLRGGGDSMFSVSSSAKTSKTSSWPLIVAGNRQKQNKQTANALAVEANLFMVFSDEVSDEDTQKRI